MEKKRIYQVAKEYHISSEALISMLRDMGYQLKSHMSVVEGDMIGKIRSQFEKQHDQAVKDIQKKKQISEAISKKTVEEPPQKKQSKPADQKKRPKKPTSQKRPPKAAAADPSDHASGKQRKKEKDKTPPKKKTGKTPKKSETKTNLAHKKDEKKSRRSRKRRKRVDQAVVQDTYKKTMASLASETHTRSKKSRTKHPDKKNETKDEAVVKVSEFVSASELATQMGIPVTSLIAKCLELGLMVSVNQRLDMETIELLSEEFGYQVEKLGEYAEDVLKARENEEEADEDMLDRAPVVTVMGHVDHGKTSLLDFIRNSNITSGESGGITQHIGAYSVKLPQGQNMTFIDTPGHHAFTAMRARGAQVTDIVILIVAADDSVMPQTIEAIDHAKAAGVPIIIAINKIDLPTADTEKIKSDLSRHNVLVEDWGGTYQCQEISAKKGINVDKLLEKVILEAEMLELKANPDKLVSGVIIDSKLDRGRGALATVLVQTGTLHIGDPFIAGMVTGRVRAMLDEYGKRLTKAGPSTPVQIFGMDGVPRAGDTFYSVDDEGEARDIAHKRRAQKREQDFRRIKRVTLSDIYDRIKEGEMKDLNLIIKADVDGSVEALADALTQITHDEVRVQVIHRGVGGINENDVLLAAASGAIIIGFHVRPTPDARIVAEQENVEIKLYEIIYEVIDDVKKALSGLLAPKITEKTVGIAQVREIFKVPRIGNIAGCFVINGTIKRNSKVHLIRDSIEIYAGAIESLKRFKEDAGEVQQGYECGISIENFDDFKVGDEIEAIEVIEEARKL